MILDMNMDPSEYPDSDPETQDWLADLDTLKVETTNNATNSKYNSSLNQNYPKLMCVSMALCSCTENSCQLSRIAPIDSQVLTVYYGNFPLNITLDSGATVSFVLKSTCEKLNINMLPNG